MKISLKQFDKKVFELYHEASNKIRKAERIMIFTHNDLDGIASFEILTQLFLRLKKLFKILKVSKISDKLLEKYTSRNFDLFLFADLGASDRKKIYSILKDKEILILDHHSYDDEIKESSRTCFIHPALWGGNGERDSCGSSLSFGLFLSFISHRREIQQLLPSLFVGIVSDKQNKPFSNFNRFLLDFFITQGMISKNKDMVYHSFFKAEECLAYNIYPFLKIFSGDLSQARNFLKERDIVPSMKYLMIEPRKRKALEEEILFLLKKQSRNPEIWNFEKRERYFFPNLNLSFEDSEILYRFLQYFIPNFKISFSNRMLLSDILKFLNKNMFKLISLIPFSEIIQERKGYYYMINEKNLFSALVCEIAYFYFTDMKKPFFLFRGLNEGVIKISARSSRKLVSKGIDLSKILEKLTHSFGGNGGGHPIASGGFVSGISLEKFLISLDSYFENE